MKQEGVIYHLSRTGEAGMDALGAAVSSTPGRTETVTIRFQQNIESLRRFLIR